MLQKHAAVLKGEYHEWYEDNGPLAARVARDGDGPGHRAAQPGHAIPGVRAESPTSAITSRSTTDCCGLMQTLGNLCPRCFHVVWFREDVR